MEADPIGIFTTFQFETGMIHLVAVYTKPISPFWSFTSKAHAIYRRHPRLVEKEQDDATQIEARQLL